METRPELALGTGSDYRETTARWQHESCRGLAGACGGRASPVSFRAPAGAGSGAPRGPCPGPALLSGRPGDPRRDRPLRSPQAGVPRSAAERPHQRYSKLSSQIFPVPGNPLLYVRNHIDNTGFADPWRRRSACSNETVECHRWRRALAAMGAFGRLRHGSRRARGGREGGATDRRPGPAPGAGRLVSAKTIPEAPAAARRSQIMRHCCRNTSKDQNATV